MKKFTVEITEILQKQILIEADSESGAIEKILEMHNNEEIVLDADDFVEVEFELILDGKITP